MKRIKKYHLLKQINFGSGLTVKQIHAKINEIEPTALSRIYKWIYAGRLVLRRETIEGKKYYKKGWLN